MVSSTDQPEQHMRQPSRPLRIIIIGAGIAGLTLGIVLRRNGHEVQIYEQSRFARELGAAIHAPPNAHGLYNALGIDLAATGATEVQYVREYAPTGEIIREIPVSKINAIWQHSWQLAHRVRIHDALKETALSPAGQGQPCVLHLASSVASVDAETATIELGNGTSVTADVVVGADGVHSKTRRLIPGGEDSKLIGSGKSAFRFMIRREDALKDPRTKKLCEQDGTFSVVIGSDRRIIMYPTSDNTLLNFVCIHPESASEAGNDWSTSTSLEALLRVYENFGPEFTAILSKADPESLKLWKLWDMENMPAWTHARLALIGDAAHPFLPHQGQGGAVAMEDAVALGTVLEEGLTEAEVPARLRLYNEIRYERACKIQQFTRLAGLDVQDGKLDTIEFANYNFGHDEFHNSAQKLREWKWKQLSKSAFRMPVAFGPDPSMLTQTTKSPTPASFQSITVSFKTSRTLIKNLFPPGNTNFTFDMPGTVAICSLVQTTFNNVEWLGGESYRTLALYIHGISYTGAEGQKVKGVFVPVMFEDLPYALVRDREVYGLPAIYGQISAEHYSTRYAVTAGFNGVDWATVVLEDLQQSDALGSQTTNGTGLVDDVEQSSLLAWRSMPAFGGGEDSFAVKVSPAEGGSAIKVQERWTTTNVSIHLGIGDKKVQPFVSDVVERLAEIPIYHVLGSRVTKGTGVPSFDHAQKLA